MRSKRRLVLEHLEDRLTPATTGITWPDPGHLTLSFVKDNTDVQGTPSDLFNLLNAQAPTAVWQTVMLKAMETWLSPTNINVGVVADGAQPEGAPGAVQGDARFGDIRIAARALADSAVSTAAFFNYASTTWSGDVQLNDQANFSVNGNGPSGSIDLYTIALHELAHSLGIKDTWTDQSTVMFGNYLGTRAGLNSQDIADIQSLYGVRQPDAFDAKKSNDSFATATPINNLSSQLAFDADLTTSSDVDYYKITTPLALGMTSIRVQIQSAGYSLLTPMVSIYDASHRLVGAASSTSPLNNNIQVTIPGALPLSTYYIKVEHATTDFAVGGYQANVTYQSGLLTLGGAVSTLNYVVDYGLNNVIQLATVLAPAIGAKSDERFDYLYRANISDASDKDYYQVQAPVTNVAGAGWTMHTLVWAADGNMLHPQIHLFDAQGNAVPVTILSNTDGQYTIESAALSPGAAYYIDVQAWTPTGANNVGNYVLAVKFDYSAPVAFALMEAATLTASSPSNSGTLTMNQNELFEFSLAADTLDSSKDASVTMTVYDSQGNKVTSLTAVAGRPPVTRLVYLTTGKYTVVFTAQSLSGAAMPAVNYWFTGDDLTDPSGPYYVSPTGDSVDGSGTGTTGTGSGTGDSSSGSGYASTKPSSGASQPFYY